MEKDKEIAYEMAILLKENRDLKQEIAEMREDYKELMNDYKLLLEEGEKPKRSVKTSHLFDAATDVGEGDYVVITKCSSYSNMFDKGFVMLVDHVSSSANGLKTLYGYYLKCDDIRHKSAEKTVTRINNKSYGWKRIETAQMSSLAWVLGKSREKATVSSYVNGVIVSGHYECRDLVEL